MIKFMEMTEGTEGMYRTMAHRCARCGQYIKAGEMFKMLIVYGLKNERGTYISDCVWEQYKNDFGNRFIHKECYEAIEGNNHFEKLVKIYNSTWKKPNTKQKDLINHEEINKFKENLISKCGKILKETDRTIKFKLNDYTYILNKLTKVINSTYKGKDPLVSLIANVSFYEIMN